MHTFCSSLTKFLSMKSVQTRFVAPQKLLIDTFLVIKMIINCDNFIAIEPMKYLEHDLVFLIFTDKNLAGKQEPGLREKITEITDYITEKRLLRT